MIAQNGTPAPDRPRPPLALRRGRHGWLWFFLVVFVLAVAAVAILWNYNVQQQLTPEKLAQARAQWREHGPKDYDLTYSEKGSVNARFTIRVRGGQVVYAEPDSRPLAKKQPYYGMPSLFNYIEGFRKEAAKPGSPRTYLVANFDPHDGHLEHFVRRVMGTQERLEIVVERFKPVPPGTAANP